MGRPGRKKGGVNFKTVIRLEKVVALEAKGLLDAEIAFQVGITPAGLATLKRNPLYKSIRTRALTGVIGAVDEEIAGSIEYQHQRLREMVPTALQKLADHLLNPDPKVSLSAIGEVLDRDGKLAKVSRIGAPTEMQGGAGIDTTRADALVATLAGK